MKIIKRKLFAIYKNGEHKGNDAGLSPSEAIKNYVIDSSFEEFLDNSEFMSQYSATEAIENVHFSADLISIT